MRFSITCACATFAVGAYAWQVKPGSWDKYASERGYNRYNDPKEHGNVHAREADPEAVEAWEDAHGGKAPVYKGYGEHNGHYVARSEHHENAGHEFQSAHQPAHGYHVARDVEFDDDDEEVDTSLEGYDHDLVARQVYRQHLGHAPVVIPVLPDVDTSGDTLAARSMPYEHVGHASYEPEHMPAHGHHAARSIPDFDEEDIDTSLNGYDHDLVARALEEYTEDDDEEPEILARFAPDWEEETSKWKSGFHSATEKAKSGVWGEPRTHVSTEHSGRAKSTHVARAIKDTWKSYTGQDGEEHEHGPEAASHSMRHYARSAKGKLVYSHEPVHDNDYHGERHHARDAEAEAYIYGNPREGAQHGEHGSAGHFHAERGMPYEHGHYEEEHVSAFHRPHQARDAAQHGYHEEEEEHVSAFHRPHQARDAMPASEHHTAHASATHRAHTEHDGWIKQTASRTATKTGGWGFPW